MGRPKIPLEILKLRGTVKPGRIKHEGELQDDGLPAIPTDPPEDLDEAEGVVWRETVSAVPFLRAVDKPLLMAFCRAVSKQNANLMIRLAHALRITPATRPRMAPPIPAAESDWNRMKRTADAPAKGTPSG